MKKTFVERSLALLLTFIIVAGMVPVFSTPAEAAGAVETHDVDKIKSLLEEDGSVIIVLDGDAKKTVDELSADYWCVLGQGNKTLDLNGHELRVDLDDARGGSGKYNRVVTMFGVFSGTTLTLNDTSGKDTGEIFLNGCMRDANEAIGGFQTYMEGNVVHRNGIMVDGGEFIMNGGTIVGGRSREEWATAALNVDKVLGELNWGKLQLEEIDVGINFKFTGDIYHQIHCDGLTIKSGNVVINAGTIEGRGFRKYAIVSESGDKMPPYDFDYDRAAGLYMTGGTLTVNNGYFKGYGGANAMSISSSAKKNVVFRAGDFYVRDLGKTYVPGPDLPMGASKWLQHRNWFMSTGYGSFGFNGLYDSDLIDVEESGHSAHLVPKQNFPFSLLNETSGETADHIVWNGKNNLYVSATITPYWPESQVPYHMGGINESGPVHYLFARAESSKDVGVTAGVSIGGTTVSEGGGTTSVEKKLYTNNILNESTGQLRVNVKDLAPDGTKVGDSFRICVMWADILQDASNSPSKSILYKTDFIVNVRENDLAVIQDPITQEAGVGYTVSLTAKAENATAAYWECIYPVSEIYDGTFDAGTGTATLNVEVFSSGRQYVCHFVNSMGEVTTKAATVFPVIPFSGTETITELLFYATSGSAYIRPSNEIYGTVRRARTKMEWYYMSTEPTSTSRATLIPDNKTKYEYGPAFYASDLTIKNPTSADNGYYYVIYEYEVGDETRIVKSGYYHVTVIDPQNEITHVNIYGLEDLFVGDLAPTVSDLSTDDTRVKVTDIDWSFLANNEGYIQNSTGPLYISLSRTDPSVQITLDPSNGNSFKAVFDNNRPAYGYDTDGDTVKVSYTIDPHTAIPFPQLKIQMQSGTSYVFTEGEEVDTRLDYVLWNDYRTSACYYVTGLHLFTTDSEHTGYRLPNGLSLVQEDDSWYIRGTVTEPASEKPMQMLIYFDCKSINGTKNGVGVLFYFTIKPKMQTMFLPKNLADLSHEHTYGTWVDDGNGTTHTQTCTGCGNQETVQHAFDEGVVTKAATGSESGVMTYTCEICGGIKTEVIDPHGMSNIKKVDKVPSSCIDPGCKEHYTCVDCGDLFYDADATKPITDPTDLILELAEHSEAEAVEENRVEATCAKEGSYDEVVYCSVCGEEISRVTKTIEKLTTHTPAEAVKENEVAATCKAEGSYDEVIYCSVCGEKLSTEKKIVEKTAHTPADAVQENVVGATCTTAGSYDEVVYCSVCGEEISRVAHTGELIEHDWSEWKETTAPTCTTKGLRTRTCSVCGTEETEEIDVVDHEFEITNTVEATCEEDGYVVSICKICGEKNVETLKKLGHKWDEGTVITEPTCLDDGEKTFTCLNDSTHTKTEKVAALGHDWGKWTVTKEATEDEEGEETRTCARCGEEETRPIAKISNTDFEEALARSLRYAAMTLRQRAAVEEAARKATEEAAKKAAEEAAKKALPFTDVAKDSPAYDDIKYAYDNGILIGLSDTTFGENIPLTRGMIVTVLWRMEGKPEVAYTGVFTDVPAGEWYTDGVEWAASKGIVLGYGDDTFGPQNNVTREQLAAILFRYAQYKGYDVSVGEDTNILSYYDAFTWGQWAVPALQWACGAGVIEDSPFGMLRPTEPATRGEIALAIHVFCEEVAK